MNIPDVAIGPIIAAIFGGLATYLISVISKEQKTSEFRQQWIDELREDLSQFSAEAYELFSFVHHQYSKSASKENNDEFLENLFDHTMKVETAKNRIILRLNRKEHQKLLDLLKNYEIKIPLAYDTLEDEDERKNELNKIVASFLMESQNVLKNEWERVKNGEPIFRYTKWISLSFIAGPAAYILIKYIISEFVQFFR